MSHKKDARLIWVKKHRKPVKQRRICGKLLLEIGLSRRVKQPLDVASTGTSGVCSSIAFDVPCVVNIVFISVVDVVVRRDGEGSVFSTDGVVLTFTCCVSGGPSATRGTHFCSSSVTNTKLHVTIRHHKTC